MGYPHPEAPASLVPQGATLRNASLVLRGATAQKTPQVPKGVGAELQPARRPQGGWALATCITSIVLAVLLAVTMLPAAGLSSAFADEPVERPATSGGDVALESTNDSATEPQTPIAETREDGMLAADGLLYTVADGGLSLAGFDGAAPEGALAVPDTISVDGKDIPVVAISIAEGQLADQVAVLSLPQSIKDIDTASLALAFPNLRSVEAAGAAGASLPAASGASSMRAVYSTSGGMLFRPTSVTFQNEDGSIETIECRELVWAPPALVSARIPVDCRAVAAGAFADVRNLQTVVCFGTMERIADDAFSVDQMEKAKVVIPASSPAVSGEGAGRVSASMALMSGAGQKERRYAWHEAGWRTDDIVMGKPYGSLTETLAVTDEGALASEEAQLISYPNMHPKAMDVKHPDETGKIDMAESGLAFTVKSDMTASVAWRGDPAATPAHVDIPPSVSIDGVTYPVTEVAPNAFKGAVFLTSVAVPEGVAVIGEGAFEDCANLAALDTPASLREIGVTALKGTPAQLSWAQAGEDAMADKGDGDAASVSTGERVLPSTQEMPAPVEDTNEPIEEPFREDIEKHSEDEMAIASKDEPQSDDESISAYTSNTSTIKLYSYPLSISSLSITPSEGFLVGIPESDRVVTCSFRRELADATYSWTSFVNNHNQAVFRLYNKDGHTRDAELIVTAPSGFVILAAGVYGTSQISWKNSSTEYLWVTAGRSQIMGSSPLLTEAAAAAAYQPKGSYASSTHNHDGTYAKSSHTHGAGDITSGIFSTDRIPNLSASKITSGTFGTNRLTDAAVTAAKIKDLNVTTDKIANLNVTEGKLAADAVTTAKIKNLNVTADKLAADAVTEAKIKDAAVTTNKIKDLNVTEGKLAADAVTEAKIKNGAVTTNKIADANVTEKKLAADAVTTDKIKDGNVTEAKIKDAAVTTNKIKDLNVTTGKLADKAVTNDKIADGTIADDKLASTFVKPTEFGSVRYDNVYDAETNTYPTMYRRGGTPAVHEPHREGYEFLGWEWQRAGSSPASGSGDIAPAFAEAGEVTLRAIWKEVIPEANHFFTSDVPLKAEDNAERQSHVVAVRLADFERSLRRVAFERNDATGLLREGAEIELWVGNTPDVIGTGTRLALGETDEAWLPSMPLARIGDESWGVYVGVRIRTADVDASRLVASYASGAYVVSLVKMSYEFA